MIEETPGAGPNETTAPETALETPDTPAADAASPTELPSADAGSSDPPEDAAPPELVDDEPEQQPVAHGGDQVAQQVAHDEAQGFHGQEVDQTPNEHYTAPQGDVAEGEPTAENPEGSDAQ